MVWKGDNIEEFSKKFTSCDCQLIIPPRKLPGISEAATQLEILRKKHVEAFWNINDRHGIKDDAIFVGAIAQAIKKQGSLRLMRLLPFIIKVLKGESKCLPISS